jgi:hypothetical protein
MQTLGAAQLLRVWEHGIGLPSPRRALALLRAACPESSGEEIAALTLGQRDDLLLQLREHLFGSRLDLSVPCPSCREPLESTLEVGALGIGADRAAPVPSALEQSLRIEDRCIRFHAPTAGDLVDLPADPAAARLALLSRCVIEASPSDRSGTGVETLPDAVVDAISKAMSAADPHADTELALACPGCGHRWQCAFDIAAFLWHEIDAWAQRTLREVHALARGYGWCEDDILALTPTRRQIYLEMIRP